MVRRKSIIHGASRKRGTKVRTPPSRSNITREVDNTSESSDTDKSNRSEDKVPRTRVKVVRRSQVVGSQNKRKQKAALAAKKGLTRRTKNSHHISKSAVVSSSSSEESDQDNTSTVQVGSAPFLRILTYETDSESEDMDPLIQQHANETTIQTCYPMLLGHILMSVQVGSQNKMQFRHLYLLNRFRFQSLHRYHLRLSARFGLTSTLILQLYFQTITLNLNNKNSLCS